MRGLGTDAHVVRQQRPDGGRPALAERHVDTGHAHRHRWPVDREDEMGLGMGVRCQRHPERVQADPAEASLATRDDSVHD